MQSDRNYAGRRVISIAIVACVAMATLGLFARNAIDHPPIYDELLHVLAARGIVATGAPVVADGSYTRALAYSQAVAWAFEIRGDDLVSARLPALVAGLLLVALVSGWIALRTGFVPGVVTAIVLAISPITVQMSVFARFYTFHALAIGVVAIAAFEATAPARPVASRWLFAAASIAALAAAWQLQETTAIVALALGAACTLSLWIDHPYRPSWWRDGKVIIPLFAATLLVIIATGWFVSRSGSRFVAAPDWAAHHAREPQYYLIRGAEQLPMLWPLVPMMAVLAVTRWKRVAAYATTFFVVAFVCHSVAAQKSMRYLFYAWPFLGAVLGCGLTVTAEAGVHLARRLDWPSKSYATWAFAGLAALVVLMSQEGQRTLKWLSGDLLPFESQAYELDWTEALGPLAPEIRKHDVLVTSNSMKALYYIGDYDYEFNPSVVPETRSGAEFGTDYRTGRRVIGTVASLAQVVQASKEVLVLVEQKKIDSPFYTRTGIVEWLDANCAELATDSAGPLRAWTCK